MAQLDDLIRIGSPDEIRETIRRLTADRDAALKRAETAEQLAVWAVRHGAFINDEIPDQNAVIGYWGPNHFHGEPEQDICDATDAGILDALRRAMEESSDGVA